MQLRSIASDDTAITFAPVRDWQAYTLALVPSKVTGKALLLDYQREVETIVDALRRDRPEIAALIGL